MYDLLIRGGTVIDPSQSIHALNDVAVEAGKIARVAPGIPVEEAVRVIDVPGKLVTPGLIDLHTHVYDGVNGNGVRADLGGESVVLTDGAVAQTDGEIVDVGSYDDLRGRFPDAEVVGNGRQFLMPGMVNAHHHGRGLSGLLLGQPDGGLETWINHSWGRRGVDPYNMMRYTLLNLIRSGVTTVMFNQSATARRMV